MKRSGFIRRKPLRGKRVKRSAHYWYMRKVCKVAGCVLCGAPAIPAHIRYSDAAAGKVNPGMGQKDDDYILPLCSRHHTDGPDAQHASGERQWWQEQGIDPIALCDALRAVSGDVEKGRRIVRRALMERT